VTDVIRTSQLYDQGLAKYDLARLLRAGELERVQRGAYAAPLPENAFDADRHRRQIAAALTRLDPAAVISHGSAAVLHGLPCLSMSLRQVHITKPRPSGGQRRRFVHLHAAPLAPEDVVLVNGIAVTSVARTVLDLARCLPMPESVAIGDHALSAGLDRGELQAGLARMTSWPGVRAARRACGCLDARSESVGESMSRVRFVEQGIPAPEVQYKVYDQESGELIARCDFGWEDHRTLGEFDGQVKYGRLLRPGQTGGDAVFAEKQREDALRDRGWQVVRWIWDDLERFDLVGDRIVRAFERAAGTHPSARAAISRPVRRLH
jgi:hypothetical protein